MAYSITEPDNQYLPSENPAWFVADSTDKNEESFVYRYRLQLTETTDTFTTGTTGADVVGTFRIPPRPVTGIGYFSPMSIARSYTTTPLEFPGPSTVGLTGAGVKKFRIIYGQEYVTTSGATGTDSATGGTHYIWNSILLDEDYPSYNEDTYVINDYATATDTLLLTDGPNNRCALDYDLLYALIGGGGTFDGERTVTDMIYGSQNFFQSPPNFAYWDEVKPLNDSSGTYTWTTVGGQGIQAPSIPSGDVSLAFTYNQTDVYGAGYILGPVYNGYEVTIYMDTYISSAGIGTYNEMWLYGKNLSGDWVPITVFLETDQAGDIRYYLEDYVITSTYQQLGMAFKNVGEANRPTISQLTTFTINSGSPLYWEVDSSASVIPRRYPINFSPNEVWLTYVTAGKQGILPSGVDADVYIVNGNGVRLSEIFTYSDDNCNNCSNCDRIQLTWLNSLGGYDSYEFNCLSGKELETTRVVGERTLTPGYVKGQRGRLNTSNVAKRSKAVSTNFETQTTVDWLESLFMSVDVYEVQSDGSFIPVIIDTNSYSQFVRQDKLKQVEFAYSLGYNRKSQIL